MRMYGDGQKGFFDMQPGLEFNVYMGYRVYDSQDATRARNYRDYEDVSFKLLNTQWKTKAKKAVKTTKKTTANKSEKTQ